MSSVITKVQKSQKGARVMKRLLYVVLFTVIGAGIFSGGCNTLKLEPDGSVVFWEKEWQLKKNRAFEGDNSAFKVEPVYSAVSDTDQFGLSDWSN